MLALLAPPDHAALGVDVLPAKRHGSVLVIPQIFHLTAPTLQLSWEERQMRRRMERTLVGWQGHLWDDAANDALIREHFPQFHEQYARIAFGVMQADIARCAYMHAFGGFYFDTDYKLLKPMDAHLMSQVCILPLEEGAEGTQDFKIGNAVLGSQAGHPFWSAFIAHIFQAHAPEVLEDHRRIPLISGPRGMTLFYLANRDRFGDVYFPPRNAFHPDRTWFGLGQRAGEAAFGSHLCWASWRGKSPRRAVTNYLRRKLTAAPI